MLLIRKLLQQALDHIQLDMPFRCSPQMGQQVPTELGSHQGLAQLFQACDNELSQQAGGETNTFWDLCMVVRSLKSSMWDSTN